MSRRHCVTLRPDYACDPPDFLTVEEAAEVLRIGRTAAYQLTRRYLDTDGADGIPATRVGRQVRVPRLRLETMLGGPITWPPAIQQATQTVPPVPAGQHEPPTQSAESVAERPRTQTSLPI